LQIPLTSWCLNLDASDMLNFVSLKLNSWSYLPKFVYQFWSLWSMTSFFQSFRPKNVTSSLTPHLFLHIMSSPLGDTICPSLEKWLWNWMWNILHFLNWSIFDPHCGVGGEEFCLLLCFLILASKPNWRWSPPR
jgi:hypothetical protein